MTPDERAKLRAVTRRLRQRFERQGDAIAGLREALDAVSQTHDEMRARFPIVNDHDDHAEDP